MLEATGDAERFSDDGQTIPALKSLLRRVLRESLDSIWRLCQKYSVLRFFFEGMFLPETKPCPLLKIYEKYESFE